MCKKTARPRRLRSRSAPSLGRSRHAFVVFERAFDGISDIPGPDLMQSPPVADILHRAWQRHALAVSSAYQLIRDQSLPAAERQTSVVFAEPVYSGRGSAFPDRFEGWIVMLVRGQAFLVETLLQRGQGAVHVNVAESTAHGRVLTSMRPGRRARIGTLVRHRTLFVGQRRWQLTVWPTTRILAATDRGMSGFAVAAGAALALTAGAMTACLAGGRSRALQRVERATDALRRDIVRREHAEAQFRDSEQQLRHLAFHDPLTGRPTAHCSTTAWPGTCCGDPCGAPGRALVHRLGRLQAGQRPARAPGR
ncbi:CHASE domain-containing protein [Cryptosporangium sp. NPDC048952]|uniref:CHASE domain-containing protein n=1 Tax=Cryptosporangium sp. NPDC048952 TaxID=3363961 RepID=UPI0037198A83